MLSPGVFSRSQDDHLHFSVHMSNFLTREREERANCSSFEDFSPIPRHYLQVPNHSGSERGVTRFLHRWTTKYISWAQFRKRKQTALHSNAFYTFSPLPSSLTAFFHLNLRVDSLALFLPHWSQSRGESSKARMRGTFPDVPQTHHRTRICDVTLMHSLGDSVWMCWSKNLKRHWGCKWTWRPNCFSYGRDSRWNQVLLFFTPTFTGLNWRLGQLTAFATEN